MAELLYEGFNQSFSGYCFIWRWTFHANTPTFSTASFSSVQHQAFQPDSNRKKVGKPPNALLVQLQGTTHACSSKQQEAEKQWQLAAVLPASSPSSPAWTARPAPTACTISSATKKGWGKPRPLGRGEIKPRPPPVPNLLRSFPHFQLSVFHTKSSSKKSLQWHFMLNRLLNGRWT